MKKKTEQGHDYSFGHPAFHDPRYPMPDTRYYLASGIGFSIGLSYDQTRYY